MRKGKLFIISSVAGGGKSTLIGMVLKDYPECKFSVSVTSRQPRPGDVEGVTYHFVSKNEFETLIEKDSFFEWAVVHGNYYGTPKNLIFENLEKGNNVILDIDVQGASIVKKKIPECISIFILPPDTETWINRLQSRATDNPEEIKKRIKNGEMELKLSEKFDYRIVNSDLQTAYNELVKILFQK
ncbi:MAG: guanylate kinase [Leptospiraceae bacterium]|nr:guanylate kinase [Leptospiraceae bacterium]MCK6380412.1 guanylate kinase [Leptospiraceae bacterium]